MSTYYETGGAKSPEAARVLARYLPGNVGNVLDAGCGDGTMLAEVRRRAVTMTGVDFHADAQRLCAQRVPEAAVVTADVQEGLPFADGTFDTVMFCDVIEHLRAPVPALHEIKRVLRAGGRMLVTTPNANSPVRILKGRSWFGTADPGHLILFTAFTLRHVLQRAGFRIEIAAIEGLTGTIADPLLRLSRSGGTLVFVASKP